MTALWYNGHQLEPHLSVSGCIYDSAICMEFSNWSVILSYHSPAPSLELHCTLCHSFFPHYYKDERISVVSIYHIVGPAMPRPAHRFGTQSFHLQCVASTTHWGSRVPWVSKLPLLLVGRVLAHSLPWPISLSYVGALTRVCTCR